MSHRRRMLGTAIGSFLIGGVTVGLALGVAGALPATEGGIALGALLVFPIFLKVLFGFVLVGLLLRFLGFRRQWAGGPPWVHGDPRLRMDEWHRTAHERSDAVGDDQNAPGEVDPRR